VNAARCSTTPRPVSIAFPERDTRATSGLPAGDCGGNELGARGEEVASLAGLSSLVAKWRPILLQGTLRGCRACGRLDRVCIARAY
jgi:hypothetical protein